MFAKQTSKSSSVIKEAKIDEEETMRALVSYKTSRAVNVARLFCRRFLTRQHTSHQVRVIIEADMIFKFIMANELILICHERILLRMFMHSARPQALSRIQTA